MGRSKEFEENTVLQKAMEVFWQQGYEKTSMSGIVEHMGIHRKSIYDTFGDKHAFCDHEVLVKVKVAAVNPLEIKV